MLVVRSGQRPVVSVGCDLGLRVRIGTSGALEDRPEQSLFFLVGVAGEIHHTHLVSQRVHGRHKSRHAQVLVQAESAVPDGLGRRRRSALLAAAAGGRSALGPWSSAKQSSLFTVTLGRKQLSATAVAGALVNLAASSLDVKKTTRSCCCRRRRRLLRCSHHRRRCAHRSTGSRGTTPSLPYGREHCCCLLACWLRRRRYRRRRLLCWKDEYLLLAKCLSQYEWIREEMKQDINPHSTQHQLFVMKSEACL